MFTGREIILYLMLQVLKIFVIRLCRKKNPIWGDRYQDFKDLSIIVLLMENKAHLIKDGLEEMKKYSKGN